MKFANFLLIFSFVLMGLNDPKEKNIELLAPVSKLTVTGTSNLHEWEMSLTKFEGNAIVQLDSNNLIERINSLHINFYTKSFSSGNSIMNSKTYTALKADSYPLINFKLTGTKKITSENNKQIIDALGKITIAGVTKETEIVVSSTVNAKGQIDFKGKKDLNLLDFAVKPPEALFGTLKTGNKVEIFFDVMFNEKK